MCSYIAHNYPNFFTQFFLGLDGKCRETQAGVGYIVRKEEFRRILSNAWKSLGVERQRQDTGWKESK